ncbi:MAG TPA: TrkA family potassium uptake protein [Phycisphaerae bacterium]|nr:TrkA family potassium uptake protein [Phycisphaerae bacterium]
MKRFLIIGLGRFGRRLAQALTEAGQEVIAADIREDLVERVRDEVALAVHLDATDPEPLRSQDLAGVDAAVVSIGEDFEANVLATTTLKAMGVPRVISRASSDVQRRILIRVGADEVIFPEEERADRLATQLANPNILEHLALSEGHSLVQIRAPAAWFDKTVGEIDLRRKYEVNLVAIKRPTGQAKTGAEAAGEEPTLLEMPMAQTVIRERDILVLVGSTERLAALPT